MPKGRVEVHAGPFVKLIVDSGVVTTARVFWLMVHGSGRKLVLDRVKVVMVWFQKTLRSVRRLTILNGAELVGIGLGREGL